MSVRGLKDEILAFDWSAYSGPDGYEPEQVIRALHGLLDLEDESRNQAAYNNILSAIGNNHAGVYYPVIEKALKYIVAVALTGESEIARNCSLNLLLDLYESFEPGPGNEALMAEVESIIESIEKELEALVSNSGESDRNRKLVVEL